MHLLRPATVAARNICDNRARPKAFHDNLCLQLIRPALSTQASIHFDTRRQWSSYVVRRVVHYEPLAENAFLALLKILPKNNLKAFGATLTMHRRSLNKKNRQLG